MKTLTCIFIIFLSLNLFSNDEIKSLISTKDFKDTVKQKIENKLNEDSDLKNIYIESILESKIRGIQYDRENDPFTFDLFIKAISKGHDIECELSYYYNHPNWEFDSAQCKVKK